MDTEENDWSNFMDQSEDVFEAAQNGEEDFGNSLGLYDAYDSYNDSGDDSSDNGDELPDTRLLDEESGDHDEGQGPGDHGEGQIKGVSKYSFLNNKDGMATCEKCGTVGVKHAFYSKSKRFCSLSCSRSFATTQREGKLITPGKPTLPLAAKKGKPTSKKININKAHQNLNRFAVRGESGRVFDWGPYLMSSQAAAAPVSCFKHVPMSDCWDQMVEGVLVEVPNTDLDLPKDIKVYWIATVLKICGYKVLMRYEGFGSDGSKDFWGNLLSEDVHNVGWCATYGKMLSPPKTIKDKYSDWKEFLIKRLTGTRTIPPHFHAKSQEWLSSQRIVAGLQLEVVNKMCVSAMRVALIKEVIGGRLRLNYADTGDDIDEFWCHMTSPLIHPVGWSQVVGHKLHASHDYVNSCMSKVALQKYTPNDVTPDMFPKLKDPPHGLSFQVGMKLEAIDPLNLSAICVATVTKVLRNNYLMIGIDGSMAENGSDWFCYHATSPCIFPVGFCEINNLTMTPPRGSNAPFKWFDYLRETRSMAAPVKLFDKEIPKHGFRVGMKVEAVDLMEPRLICVATVTKIIGRLLRIHFDGWEDNYDQWIDCQSPDIYPVGWCQVMRHGLEGPRNRLEGYSPISNGPVVNARKRRGKSQMYRGPRKKRMSGSDKKPAKPVSLLTCDLGVKGQGQGVYPEVTTIKREPGSVLHSVVPPHKMLSPEAVAATLPPLLEPDIASKPVTVKTEACSPTPGDTSTPPILSPHGKVPKGFSQELAERLRANTIPFKVNMLANSSLSEKAAKPGATPTNSFRSAAVDKDSMESRSNLLVSSSHSGSEVSGDTTSDVIVLTLSSRLRALHLNKWSLSDVVDVLKVNGCGVYSNIFIKKNIDGSSLMSLTTEQLTRLVSVVEGPHSRLCDLIQQVKSCNSITGTDSASLGHV